MMPLPALVLDASVTLAWAFEDEGNAYTDLVMESLAAVKAFVPNLWPLEVGNALLVAERRGRLNQAASGNSWLFSGSFPSWWRLNGRS